VALADDSGLEVEVLGGAPGVHSARYAGQRASDEANNEKLVAALAGQRNRKARFCCALALFDPRSNQLRFSEGTCAGVIGECARGVGGFGYDPLFVPDGFGGRSFAELSAAEKDRVSHRARALRALREMLEELRRPG
jgi:XTP/dITP diphosphohydrolase